MECDRDAGTAAGSHGTAGDTRDQRPLEGVRVVALEQAVAAPLATRHLADQGATVTKVERVGGGDFARHYDTEVLGLASHFVWLNRGKESVALDVKTRAGGEVLGALLERADVFVHNLGPGSAANLGVDAGTAAATYPGLVAVEISGYGRSGPYKDRRAYDFLVQGEAGVVSVTGTPDSPAKSGIPIADIAAGMYAYSATLAALFRRERTGVGASVHVSMLEALAEWMGHPLYMATYGGGAPPRTGTAHPAIVPYDAYPTADGDLVLIGVQNDREWERLARQVLERPELLDDRELATNIGRARNRERVDYLVTKVTSGLPTGELLTRLDEASIAAGRLNSVAGLAEHPQLRELGKWQDAGSPVGPLRMLSPPAMPDGVPPGHGAIPRLGEHTDTVLARLGYTSHQVARWRADGVVA
ncbi:Crotonobetainyl-CoA:carnitine CoA-transferase CaiB [Haloechinothrix alba]|uniref:Crotonobetainyl-CoA:carnitine CoA-transferase CaiB n=1 Tax=Haloechinothrix alba TaxID=664784 RepID=A0A238X0P5_9PSEU|nr:CaiB/BaiF CoA-transferase family protein [Haloechinothrix alba]SNR52188.1 Crotonobetainyl-CoA:carnitine CoA-transferase CaiB [Haloechinothrix alba]